MSSKAGVFIIESLYFEQEEKNMFEGKILTEMLTLLDVNVQYNYIRTKDELKVMIERFENSNFKYLHLSCHGDSKGIDMTLDDNGVTFSELSDMFNYEQKNQRLFLSSCSVMKGGNIVSEMLDTQFLSITGPLNNIGFADSAIFWASFYHLMFIENESKIDNEYMKNTIEKLSSTFNVEMSTVIRKKGGNGYSQYSVRDNTLEKVN